MALAQYSDVFWFPSGVLAASLPARVFPVSSNGLASLFADAAGTIPLTNPLNTDAFGVLTFYATVGQYWIHLDTESFLVDVGMSEEQADLSTGVSTGGELSANVSNLKAVDISPLVGYIVDNTSLDPNAPSVIRVDYPGATVTLDAAAQLRSITYWMMDASQNVIQQATRPTNTQRRSNLTLGISVYDAAISQIIEVQTLQVALDQEANQLADLMDAMGPFNVTGNVISANGANLSINKSSGSLFARSFNRFFSGVLTDDPHVNASPAEVAASLRRITQTVFTPIPPIVTTIDPANYDVGGVITPVGGGSGTSTIQRVWLFVANTTAARISIQYGQRTYGSLATAISSVGAEPFVRHPATSDAAFIGYIVVTRTATNLTDPTQATLIPAGRFASP